MSTQENTEPQIVESDDPLNESKKSETQSNKTNKKKKIGSGKGVETLFRNAYRAELDLIALAATKANIMISLNGFIVSALMISGGFIYADSPMFLVPSTIFLFTSALSIYFALTAASPDAATIHTRIFSWFKGLLKRETHLGSFKDCIKPQHSFSDETSNILIYEDRVKLSKAEYLDRMHDLLSDQEQIYEKMSDQLYWLGKITHHKFRMLRASYTVFRWGIILSVLALIAVKSFEYILPSLNDLHARVNNVGISNFEDIYEPSAAQQLLDGRVLIVEDEPLHALSIVEFGSDGSISENSLLDGFLLKSFNRKLNDLEGVTMDSEGFVYAITSHSRNEKGKRKKSREQLLRFKIEGNEISDVAVYTKLVDHLVNAGVLDNILSSSGNTVNLNEINIEALSFNKEKNKLMLGFRAPLINGKSMLVVINNPSAIFERNDPAQFDSNIILLDLQGGGIRSLDYAPQLEGYLMVNEIKNNNGKKKSQLWFWKGETEKDPQPIDLPQMINLKNVEALAPVTINGEPKLFLLSDDGKYKKKKTAHYMLLEYDQLSVD